MTCRNITPPGIEQAINTTNFEKLENEKIEGGFYSNEIIGFNTTIFEKLVKKFFLRGSIPTIFIMKNFEIPMGVLFRRGLTFTVIFN